MALKMTAPHCVDSKIHRLGTEFNIVTIQTQTFNKEKMLGTDVTQRILAFTKIRKFIFYFWPLRSEKIFLTKTPPHHSVFTNAYEQPRSNRPAARGISSGTEQPRTTGAH